MLAIWYLELYFQTTTNTNHFEDASCTPELPTGDVEGRDGKGRDVMEVVGMLSCNMY